MMSPGELEAERIYALFCAKRMGKCSLRDNFNSLRRRDEFAATYLVWLLNSVSREQPAHGQAQLNLLDL